MNYFINSTSTRTQGWQADCWNWAKANEPFELHGIESQHLLFCQELSAAYHYKYHSRLFRDESVATFEPAIEPIAVASKIKRSKTGQSDEIHHHQNEGLEKAMLGLG